MKKMMILAVVAAAALMTSCGSKSVKAELKSDVDSLAYQFGLAQSDGLKQALTPQLQVDSTQMDQFIQGMMDGVENSDPGRWAYVMGYMVGKSDVKERFGKGMSMQIYGMEDTVNQVNVKNILAGMVKGLKGENPDTPEASQAKFQEMMDRVMSAQMEVRYGDNKKAGEEYLAQNAKKEGVVQLPSGVQYEILTPGNGPLPNDSSIVKVNYEGRLIDGTVFDSNAERKEPFTVNMKRPGVIEGWVEVLKMMPAGSKWRVTIPQYKAYGSREMGQIKPFSTLIFDIETLK